MLQCYADNLNCLRVQLSGDSECCGAKGIIVNLANFILEFSTRLLYTLDGKKCKNTGNFGSQESVAKWSKDGETLTISSTMARGEREFTMTLTEKWSPEYDTLVIETTRTTPRGERTSTAVYNKIQLNF